MGGGGRRTAVTAPPRAPARVARGVAAHGRGMGAEEAACEALVADGWRILRRRARTAAGEIDVVAQRDTLLAFVEVKARRSLAEASFALRPAQARRLWRAAEILLAEQPDWAQCDVRFDVILIDPAGRLRRIADALRGGDIAEASDG